MRNILIFIIFLSGSVTPFAQFTPGNIVITRVGDGSTTLNSAAHPVSLLEYTNSGTATTNVVNFPSGSSGIRLTQSGTATSEGYITVSQNGNFITVAGYDAATGTTNIANSTLPGTIGNVDINDISSPDLSYRFNRSSGNAYVSNNFRTAVTTNGTEFWGSGTGNSGTGGVRYLNTNSSPASGTQVSTTVTNTRVIQIYGGELYVSSGSNPIRLGKVGNGLPTNSGSSITNLPGLPGSGSKLDPYGFVFFDRDPSISGYDLLYVASFGSSDTSGILKYSFDGTTWTQRGEVRGTAAPSFFQATGLTGFIDCNGHVQLFVVIATAASQRGSQLYKFIDNNAYNANIANNGSNLNSVLTSPIIDYSGGNVYRLGGPAIVSKPKLTFTSGTNNIPAGDYGDIYIKSGATATLTGNITLAGTLTVESGATLDLSTYSISTSPTNNNVAASIVVSAGATLRIGSSSGLVIGAGGNINTCLVQISPAAHFVYNGSSAQFTGTGLPSNITGSLRIDNASHVTLSQSTIISGILHLTNGKLITSSSNLLTLADNATYTGGSSSSFVEGPMRKIGDEDFNFPIGKGSIYAPIGISGGTGAASTDQFTAEYIRANPQSVYGTSYATGIDHISYVEYWILDRNNGSASKVVSVRVNQESFCAVPSSTFISRFNGSQWTNETSTPVGFSACGAFQCGTLTTNNPISSFSPFTLATDLAYSVNPLPVKLTSFYAQRNGHQTHIFWQIENICHPDCVFEIQKSTDNRSFSTWRTVQAVPQSRNYSVNDTEHQTGTVWYRLRITDETGNVTYSRTVSVAAHSSALHISSVLPNPAANMVTLQYITPARERMDIRITDLSGKVLYRLHQVASAGENRIQIPVTQLPSGVYLITLSGAVHRATHRFIKY
ncbi:MAG: T9SS type A sorting domain-containing protein [Chitinophagaceae bacterium]|nr:T9SS type A sorting domain-containing protein [Chitinophagaceae bacterium]